MWPVALVGTGIALAIASNRGPKNLTDVRSMRDGKIYHVQNLPKKQEAADLMSEIQENLNKLITHYKEDPASMADPRVKVLIDRFNPEKMVENDLYSDTTSYSENKGEKIVVCLRDKTTKELVDINTIMFVILHEMAHLMTTTVGHTPEFWTNFRRILQDSVGVGIYTAVNYSRSPTLYCGMTITDSPI
jgi:predicted metal-dependent hydrolase